MADHNEYRISDKPWQPRKTTADADEDIEFAPRPYETKSLLELVGLFTLVAIGCWVFLFLSDKVWRLLDLLY